MKIVKHPFLTGTQILAMHFDQRHDQIMIGIGTKGHDRELLWYFDPATNQLRPSGAEKVFQDCLYIHRSMLTDSYGVTFAGATWVSPDPHEPDQPGKLPAGMTLVQGPFLQRLVRDSAVEDLAVTHGRVARRNDDGSWELAGLCPGLCSDLAWDPAAERMLRLSPRGISEALGTSAPILCHLPGFIHQLAVSSDGRILMSDEESVLWLYDGPAFERRRAVGRVEDFNDGPNKATPGIDACLYIAEHNCFVGGTRNLAKLFVFYLDNHELVQFDVAPYQPRLTAITVSDDGMIYFAAGVGNVCLFRFDLRSQAVLQLGEVVHDSVRCHHIHDLVMTNDGRLFAGESYPLDVFEPRRPDRPPFLWEIWVD